MKYKLKFTDDAEYDIKKLKRSEPIAYRKLIKLLAELGEHPYSGIGKVKRLKHFNEETWSRRITDKHRLVYRVFDDVVLVLVISAYGHYDDK
ncbi:MAG: Txe/YoeB family addiction module toxin [Bacteroidia bacterium]|nr:Txe/YoeB family addiction module toxin [Bacteroidia bacterium]